MSIPRNTNRVSIYYTIDNSTVKFPAHIVYYIMHFANSSGQAYVIILINHAEIIVRNTRKSDETVQCASS